VHLRVDKAASLCIRPRVPAADGPVYALWPSGYESAAHEGLLLLMLCQISDIDFILVIMKLNSNINP
jgi:hypothetical protein